jgi:coupling of ubiquitin conjugation to ER degradation protein 1
MHFAHPSSPSTFLHLHLRLRLSRLRKEPSLSGRGPLLLCISIRQSQATRPPLRPPDQNHATPTALPSDQAPESPLPKFPVHRADRFAVAHMANDQISLPYFLAILIIGGLIVRYLFFGGPAAPQARRSPEAFLRSREVAVERIQQMFPQADRRSILWDLQRNGGSIQSTTERILAGRLETVSAFPCV